MPLPFLAITLAAVAAGPAQAEPVLIDLGLSAPIERLERLDTFARLLAERLVWTVESEGGSERIGSQPVLVRFTAVRIDRGRVAASYQSELRPGRPGLATIARTIGTEQFGAFPDVCFTSEDPPARVRALSGSTRVDAATLEQVVAKAARTGRLDGSLGLDPAVELEWGRHVVLILSAVAVNEPSVARPLILVLERI